VQAQSVEPNEARERDTSPTRLPYLPRLDGLRALAVIAVLLYQKVCRRASASHWPCNHYFPHEKALRRMSGERFFLPYDHMLSGQ
jgi:peptidoglycan/LPS O-acetylase OafA/YrhL